MAGEGRSDRHLEPLLVGIGQDFGVDDQAEALDDVPELIGQLEFLGIIFVAGGNEIASADAHDDADIDHADDLVAKLVGRRLWHRLVEPHALAERPEGVMGLGEGNGEFGKGDGPVLGKPRQPARFDRPRMRRDICPIRSAAMSMVAAGASWVARDLPCAESSVWKAVRRVVRAMWAAWHVSLDCEEAALFEILRLGI